MRAYRPRQSKRRRSERQKHYAPERPGRAPRPAKSIQISLPQAEWSSLTPVAERIVRLVAAPLRNRRRIRLCTPCLSALTIL